MIKYEDIRDLHLEMSTLCNASCPLCPRNLHGYPYNNGFPETYLTLAQIKTIFSEEFVNQLEEIRVNGNFGDFITNPDAIDILTYFRNINRKIKLTITTNGSARNKQFWRDLAKVNPGVMFCLDGLEDTHHLYRKDTDFHKILENAKEFINAGGRAHWKMIKFKHNEHQIEACEKMAYELGFDRFELAYDGRDTGPVIDRKGNHIHSIGEFNSVVNFPVLLNNIKTRVITLENLSGLYPPTDKINCWAKENRSIYIAANGDISPCCWLGFFPNTYGAGTYHWAINQQLQTVAYKNNAIEYPLKECIEWFDAIEKSWQIPTHADGRLLACDRNCGCS